MLPQNAQHLRTQHHQQPGLSFMPQNPSFDHPSYFNLDPSQAAKQMAALSAASNARIAANSRAPPSMGAGGGTSSGPFLGGIGLAGYSGSKHDLLSASVNGHANFQLPINHSVPHTPNSAVNSSFLDPAMSQPSPQAVSLKQRQQSFLAGLANVMAKRNTPLPPPLTGVPTPNYDPNTSPWSYIEPSEVGSFRLAGHDVNLFKLWGLVMQHGGAQAIKANNGWPSICIEFNLPEEYPQVPIHGLTSVAAQLEQMYTAILYPFEDLYKKNIQEQQRKAQMVARQQAQMRGMPPMSIQPGQVQRGSMANDMGIMSQPVQGAVPNPNGAHFPNTGTHTPHQRPVQAVSNLGSVSQSTSQPGISHPSDSNLLDGDIQGIKRKLEAEDGDGKRARQKTDSLDNNALPSTNGDTSVPHQQPQNTIPARMRQPLRRKIEYAPLARELDTYGGRDLRLIDLEWNSVPQRRPMRDINDWGTIDIEGLRMSIRSKLPNELSYAFTTLTILSTMRGQNPGSGFPIYQCSDLFDDLLDFLEEEAFGDSPDDLPEDGNTEVPPIISHRQILDTIYEKELQPFAVLEDRQGSKHISSGPKPRPADTILTIINILRNLSVVQDNWQFLSRHDRLIDVMLRLCAITRQRHSLAPASPNLSLSDLVSIRKDTLLTLVSLAGFITLSSSSSLSPAVTRISRRAYELVASYLVHPSEAVSPYVSVQLSGQPPNASMKPPSLADMALEVFTRFSHSDANRHILSQTIPKTHIWQLFESLVHRFPLTDLDFQILGRDPWLSYLEKIIMSLYSLSFLAPPSLKQRLKSDRGLAVKNVMFRLVQKVLTNPNAELRMWFSICCRRAIETMKVLDDEGDMFDTSEPATATLSFGMGFADASDSAMEGGTGLLGGYRDAAWPVLMSRDVVEDEIMFRELESLARVECQ